MFGNDPQLKTNMGQGIKKGAQWPLSYSLAPYYQCSCPDHFHFQTQPDIDLNYTTVKFRDCMLHSRDATTLTKICPHQQRGIHTVGKVLKTISVVVPAIYDVSRATFCHDDTRTHTHSQSENITSRHCH